MISFRVSDTEYQALQMLHHLHGARNVSDFARLAVTRMISDLRVVELEQRVDLISGQLKHLGDRIDHLVSAIKVHPV
jgi:hypothetical protein